MLWYAPKPGNVSTVSFQVTPYFLWRKEESLDEEGGIGVEFVLDRSIDVMVLKPKYSDNDIRKLCKHEISVQQLESYLRTIFADFLPSVMIQWYWGATILHILKYKNVHWDIARKCKIWPSLSWYKIFASICGIHGVMFSYKGKAIGFRKHSFRRILVGAVVKK